MLYKYAALLHLHCLGDATASVSQSSMVALHTLKSHVMCVASCTVAFSSSQSNLIMSIHPFLGLPLLRCTLSWTIFHPVSGSDVQSTVAQSLALHFVSYAKQAAQQR